MCSEFKLRKEKDCAKNVRKELRALSQIRQVLQLPNLQKTGMYDKFDFFDGNVYCEYRTRNIKSTDYYTTLLPYCKIEFAQLVEEPCFICIQFTDKLMKLIVDKTKKYIVKRGGRSDRGKDEYDEKYIYEPISNFIEL